MKLITEYKFDAGHHLPNYPGKCANQHGHTYRLQVILEGKMDYKTGMIADFGEIKKVIRDNIVEKLDHKYLNDLLPIPTAETTILWIVDRLKGCIANGKVKLVSVRLWETENCSVGWP